MDNLRTYTSTGFKLIHHPDVVQRMKLQKRIMPISLQVAPTSRCNLNCSFCSNANRRKHEDLGLRSLSSILNELSRLDLKTVEWTGGGDPTLYQGINEIIGVAKFCGLEQGMITNGILVRNALTRDSLDSLKWMRISMNSLDYVDRITLPKFKGTLGFSYVWNDKTNPDTLERLQAHVEKYKPKYVRIVPNCQATKEEQEANNLILSEKVSKMGKPYFYQAKHFDKPDHCWWAYIKPFLLHDGFVYPCSSVVLNTTSEFTFHKKFRWCEMEDLPKKYATKSLPLKVIHCDHCVFSEQNNLVDEILEPTDGMENFV